MNWKQISAAAVLSFAASVAGAQAATVDTIDSTSPPSGAWGNTNYFVPNPSRTYDSPYYRRQNQDWGWAHKAITTAFDTVSLLISAFDVDYDGDPRQQSLPPERDAVSAYDSATNSWIFLGYLAGANDIYSYTTFVLGEALFDDVATGLRVRLDIDTLNSRYWGVSLAKSVLTTDNATPPPPDPGDTGPVDGQVPLPAALPLMLAGLAVMGGLRRARRKRA